MDRLEVAGKYGNDNYCVQLADKSEDFILAKRVVLTAVGVLEFYGGIEDKQELMLAYAPGVWKTFFAASVLNGQAILCHDTSGSR